MFGVGTPGGCGVGQTGRSASLLNQWIRRPGSGWSRSALDVGGNWFLTGTATAAGEVLEWRAPPRVGSTQTRVRFALLAGWWRR